MTKTLLLTSFTTWESHQFTNSSDDLVLDILKSGECIDGFHSLRLLPVDFRFAMEQAIARFNQLRPQIVVLCGMAESRQRLNLETTAYAGSKVRCTTLDVAALADGLTMTDISHDPGRFVCNGLYYAMLSYFHLHQVNSQCLFVHVPRLLPENRTAIVNDFWMLLRRLQRFEPSI